MSKPKEMSPRSSSFLRFKEFAEGINLIMDSDAFGYSKKDHLSYMIANQLNHREVFYAENINIKSTQQIKNIKIRLGKYIKEELDKMGKWAKGIVEIHPTSPNLAGKRIDRTSKHAHIHYWGNNVHLVSPLISKFIIENKLTNKTNTKLAFSTMERGVLYIENKEDTTDEGYVFDIVSNGEEVGKIVESSESIRSFEFSNDLLLNFEDDALSQLDIQKEQEKVDIDLEHLKQQKQEDIEFLKAFLTEDEGINLSTSIFSEIEKSGREITFKETLSTDELLEENRKFLDSFLSDLDIAIL